MEANEALRRVVWRHRWLLIALLLLPVVFTVLVRSDGHVRYAASAKIQTQSAAPDAQTQVDAILGRTTAIATNPVLVRQALGAAKVDRSALQVAEHEISVTILGSSAVVQLTVTDTSRSVATRLDTALADAVVNDLNGLGASTSQALTSLEGSATQLRQTRDGLVSSLNAANGPPTSAKVQSLLAQLTAVEQQLANNATATQQILANSTAGASAAVISTPTAAVGVSRHVAEYGALAGLLGLLIALLIATIRELMQPTVADPSTGAREIGTVFLGRARAAGEDIAPIDEDLALKLDLAARRLRARTLVLSGPVPSAQLTALAQHLNERLHFGQARDNHVGDAGSWGPNDLSYAHIGQTTDTEDGGSTDPSNRGAAATSDSDLDIQSIAPVWLSPVTLALHDLELTATPENPALLIVLPDFAPRDALDTATDLRVTTDWPIAGVIGLHLTHRGLSVGVAWCKTLGVAWRKIARSNPDIVGIHDASDAEIASPDNDAVVTHIPTVSSNAPASRKIPLGGAR